MRVPFRLVGALVALLALVVLAAPSAASAWTWPVDGPVLVPFSFGSDPYAGGQHRGIDIGSPTGTSVAAAAGGTVTFAGTVPKGGKTVTIQTQSGYAVTLLHLGSIGVSRGASVQEGATVGTVGPSGVPDIAEPYVYLGIRVASDDQGYVDPLLFLPPRPAPPVPAAAAGEPPTAAAPAGEAPATTPAAEASPAEGASAEGASASGATATRAGTDDASSAPAPSATPAHAADSQEQGGEQQTPAAAPAEPQADSSDSAAPAAPSAQQPVSVESAGDGATSVERVAQSAPTQVASGGTDWGRGEIVASGSPQERAPQRLPSATTQEADTASGPADAHAPRPAWGERRPEPGYAAVATVPAALPGDAAVHAAGAHWASRLAAGSMAVAGAASAAAAAAALLRLRRRPRPGTAPVGAETARIIVLLDGAEAGADPRGAGVAVRGGRTAPGSCDGVRDSGRRLRALPPLARERRLDGERDRRARDTRDGRRGQRGRLAA